VPSTARSHFNDDIGRARAMHALAVSTSQSNATLAEDIGRVAIAFGVGAMDAYLCDAFTDTLARGLKSCRRTNRALPGSYKKLELPIGPLMTPYGQRQNWGLRMAARALMERDNLLQLSRLKELFNPALPKGQKLWDDLALPYVSLDRRRLTDINSSEYAALSGTTKSKAPKKATSAVLARIGEIVQRRHDVVHNCDRPKTAKQPLTLPSAKKMLIDVKDFVTILDDHLDMHRIF
jgi:hypothetical protein